MVHLEMQTCSGDQQNSLLLLSWRKRSPPACNCSAFVNIFLLPPFPPLAFINATICGS